MNEISKIIDSINLPKQLIEKAEKLFGTLFGEAFKEFGEIIHDNVRLRRFKNQLKILSRAQELLEENGLKAKELSLKTLVPLIEYSSLEEDPFLQEKWSRLIATTSSQEEDDSFTNVYIDILNKLSSNEVKILDHLYESYLTKKLKIEETVKMDGIYSSGKEFNHDTIKFDKINTAEAFNFSESRFYQYLENLFSYGLLKWDLPEVESATSGLMKYLSSQRNNRDNSNYYPLMQGEARLVPANSFSFTYFGIGFVTACKFVK